MRERIISGVPQGSILGPLLFSIFLNNLFLFNENSDLSNYADDDTLYSSVNNLEKVKQTLRRDFQIVTKWFHVNYMDWTRVDFILCVFVRIQRTREYWNNNTEIMF